MGVMDPLVEKVLFSGATLAHIVQDCKTAAGDCDGLLFGHVRHQTVASLQDEEGPSTREQISALVTGHFSSGRVMSFYDAVGAVDRAKLGSMIGERESRGADSLIGWFMSRRNSSMRPSMREAAVTAYLRRAPAADMTNAAGSGDEGTAAAGSSGLVQGSDAQVPDLVVGTVDVPIPDASGSAARSSLRQAAKAKLLEADSSVQLSAETAPQKDAGFTLMPPHISSQVAGLPPSGPCLFFLVTESETQSMVLTHEYRAFQYHPRSRGGGSFEPRPISIVNIGPVFRGQYDAFAPFAPFPLMSGIISDLDGDGWKEGQTQVRKPGQAEGGSDIHAGQPLLDVYAEGFTMDKLLNLVRPDRSGCTTELEDLYARMLAKLEVVARQVQESSAALAEQEKLKEKLKAEYDG